MFLINHMIVQGQHPPYSPDITPKDFGCTKRKFMSRVKFENAEDIKRNTMVQLHII